jgi:hypothetical protein
VSLIFTISRPKLTLWSEEDSPYPEVRSAVANFDDPDMPCATIRSWVLGLCWAILLPGLNQFFFFRYPTVSITGVSGLLRSQLPFPDSANCYFTTDRCTIDGFPAGTAMGKIYAELEDIWPRA